MAINSYRYYRPPWDDTGNNSRYFDGTNDYVDIGSKSIAAHVHNTKVFSLACWARIAEQGTSEAFDTLMATNPASAYKGFFINYDNRAVVGTDCARLFIAHGSSGQYEELVIANKITDTGWHHWCFTGDGTTIRFYLDGVVDGTTEPVTYTTTGDSTYNLNLGRYDYSTPGGYLDGNIADARVYDDELTATEVAELASGIHVSRGLVGWWLRDTDDVLDYAGANDGTNYGSVASPDGPAVVPPYTSGLRANYDASGGAYTDAGVTPATDTGAVQQLNDLSGGGWDMTQGVAGERARFVESGIGGKPSLDFDASNDGMVSSLLMTSGDYTVFVVAEWDGTHWPGRLLQGNANWLIGFYMSKIAHYAGGWVSQSTTPTAGQPYVITATRDASGTPVSRLYVDGVDVSTTTTPSGYFNYLRLGAEGAYAEPGRGMIAKVLVYDELLGTSDRETVEAWLTANYT